MIRNTLTHTFYFVLLLAQNASAIPAGISDEQNNVDIYKKASPSVVNITTTTLRRDFFLEVVPQQGSGSGVVIRPEGYIVTNDHVIGDAQKVEVTFPDKTTAEAKIVGQDPDSDLAVLRVERKKGKDFPFVPFADPEKLAVGQKTLAIGNPFGLGSSLSVGIISSLDRAIRTPTDRLIKDVIQTDAAINPGNSGGPLLNSSGQLIGINSQILSRSGGSHGIGFAISVKTVKKVSEQLISFGRVLRPDLGMEVMRFPGPLLDALKVNAPTGGVMVLALDPKGLGAKAGLRPADREAIFGFRRIPVGGDVIFKIDSHPVATERDLLDYVFEKKPGDKITLHFARGQRRMQATVQLALPSEARGQSL